MPSNHKTGISYENSVVWGVKLCRCSKVECRQVRRGEAWRPARLARRGCGWADRALMSRNPVLDLPLTAVMRSEIALPLQHVLKLYTVGALLGAWRSPRNQKSIEQLFDSPQQARHAIATCAAWLGAHTHALHKPVAEWWPRDAAKTVIRPEC